MPIKPKKKEVKRDKRIKEVHGEFAFIDSGEVPETVTRGGGYYAAESPISDTNISLMIRSYPYTQGPGMQGDTVAVKVADLQEAGWIVEDQKDASPVSTLRTSGKVLVKEVQVGEAFDNGNGEKVIVVEKTYPADLPKEGWLWRAIGHSFEADKVVDLVPSYRTAQEPAKAPVIEATEHTFPFGNSGRTYSFVTGSNPIDGRLGWKPIDLGGTGKSPAFDPVAPVMAVHDLMEHFPGDEYDPHNEYQAQGAMLWLRFEGGFFEGLDVADQVVGPAFGMLFHHIVKGKLSTKKYDGPPDAVDPFKAMKQETAFTLLNVIAKAKQYIDGKYRYDTDQKDRSMLSLQYSIPWIVQGYKRAGERYKGLDKVRLVRLYKSTVKQIESVNAKAELKLTMDYAKYSSKVELMTPVTV